MKSFMLKSIGILLKIKPVALLFGLYSYTQFFLSVE